MHKINSIYIPTHIYITKQLEYIINYSIFNHILLQHLFGHTQIGHQESRIIHQLNRIVWGCGPYVTISGMTFNVNVQPSVVNIMLLVWLRVQLVIATFSSNYNVTNVTQLMHILCYSSLNTKALCHNKQKGCKKGQVVTVILLCYTN